MCNCTSSAEQAREQVCPMMALSNDCYKNCVRQLAHDIPGRTVGDAGNYGEDGEPGGLGAASVEKSNLFRDSLRPCPEAVKQLAEMLMKVHTGVFDTELRSIAYTELKKPGFTFA